MRRSVRTKNEKNNQAFICPVNLLTAQDDTCAVAIPDDVPEPVRALRRVDDLVCGQEGASREESVWTSSAQESACAAAKGYDAGPGDGVAAEVVDDSDAA